MDANVSSYITQFSNGEADLTAAQEFYDDIVANYLADIPILINFATNFTTTGNTFPLPSTSVEPLQVFYNNEVIGPLEIGAAQMLFDDWRETIGTPFNYVVTGNRSTITLAPKPPTPVSNGGAIYTETRQSLPTYLQLPVAFLCLYFEYNRESNHRNVPLATAYRAMGELLISVVKAQ